jgi:hypothetical protein
VPAFEVRLPGWQDIIHLTPTASLSEVERRRRQIEQIESLRRSPTPDIARHLSQLGTAIDNVQDGLVTMSVIGRIASKVAGRAIPGLGTIATGADVLNALNLFYPRVPRLTALPEIGHIVREGVRLRRWPQSKEHKRQAGVLMGLASNLYQQRLRDTVRTGRVGFGWGEALQVLQTSDELFGAGVSLGPIFGAALDTFFGLLRGARFDFSAPASNFSDLKLGSLEGSSPLFLSDPLGDPFIPSGSNQIRVLADWPGILPLLDQLSGWQPGMAERGLTQLLEPLAKPVDKAVVATLGAIGAVQKAALSAASSVWNASKWLVGVRGALSWDTHVEILVAQFLALQTISPYLQQIDWGHVFNPVARELSVELALPFLGRGGVRPRGETAGLLRDGPARFALEWLDEAPSSEAKIFTQGIISSYVDLLFESLEGPGAWVEQRSTGPGRALLAMHDVDLLPPFDRDDGETLSYISRVGDIVEEWDSVVPPRALIERAFLDSFPGGDAS